MMQRVGVISLLCWCGVATLLGCRDEAPRPPVVTTAPAEYAEVLRAYAEPVVRSMASGHVTVSASVLEQVLNEDGRASAFVELEIDPSFHLYGSVEEATPFTHLSVEVVSSDRTVSAGRAQIAEATTVQDGLPVYHDSVTAEVPLQFTDAKPGEITLEFQVRLQACNDLICLPPEDLVLELPVMLRTSRPPEGDLP